jgi:hypothetical protein
LADVLPAVASPTAAITNGVVCPNEVIFPPVGTGEGRPVCEFDTWTGTVAAIRLPFNLV